MLELLKLGVLPLFIVKVGDFAKFLGNRVKNVGFLSFFFFTLVTDLFFCHSVFIGTSSSGFIFKNVGCPEIKLSC